MKNRLNLLLLFTLLIIFSLFNQTVHGAVSAGERTALIAFYNASNGDTWGKDTWKNPPLSPDGFSQSGSENDWIGITVASDQVITINLEGMGINGSIPAELQNLPHLQRLNLKLNNFSGTIPKELGNLTSLEYLRLANNKLSGNIPVELGNLANLIDLSLFDNQLTGSIPLELGNLVSLTSLFLYSNQLTGSIPPELGNLSSLSHLSLERNQLTGSIPVELGNLVNLGTLDLAENNLTGNIPDQLKNLTKLWRLSLSYNKLEGSIPSSIGNLRNLQLLYLRSNQLMGSIPLQLGNLINLKSLSLDANLLDGKIPTELGNLINLGVLNLAGNQLSGTIPSELGNITDLRELFLNGNLLEGGIPSALGNLTALNTLDLSDNQLSGSLPPQLSNLTAIIYLSLNSNRLSGMIPVNFTNLVNLSSTLDIGYNGLYTENESVVNFLDSRDHDWRLTQTILPANLAAATVNTTSIKVSWTPIPYTANSGGYMVYYSTTSGGPWTYASITAGKTASSYTATGLNPNTTYYFIITTRTDSHANNKNSITSPFSSEVIAATGSTGTTFILNVLSAPDHSVPITVSLKDKNNNQDGTTNFSRIYDAGATVSLTAPAEFSGNPFSKWSVNGTDHFNETIEVTMNQDHTLSIIYSEPTKEPAIALSRTQFNFGASLASPVSDSQSLWIRNSGGGIMNWVAEPSVSWLKLSPYTGSGFSEVLITVDATGLSVGTYTGSITVSSIGVSNSPRTVNVSLTLHSSTSPPYGSFDSPIGGTTVQSSIPVTGWVLDDIGVQKVEIHRDPISASETGLIYVGDAVFVEGARTDVEAAYPGVPMNHKAGWGYMLLTNLLPGEKRSGEKHRDGPLTLYVIATDKEGNQVTIGSKTVTIDNANAVKPFGAIDTPTQGGVADGDDFVVFGWVLTPGQNTIPTDGSTISVWVDSVKLGNPTYNIYREDIATLFPGYTNSNGAIGYFYLDTNEYENGVHTIQWSATDSAGNTDGIGSRYFSIQNANTGASKNNGSSLQYCDASQLASIPFNTISAISVKKGFQYKAGSGEKSIKTFTQKRYGVVSINSQPMEPIAISFPKDARSLSGYLNVGNRLTALPIGSTLDPRRSLFSWHPGMGFTGTFELEFLYIEKNNQLVRNRVIIKITTGHEEKLLQNR